MWNTVIVYLISTTIALIIYLRWTRRKILAAVANMNGPPRLPLIGNAYILVRFTSTEAIYHNLKNLGNYYPSPLCIHIGPSVNVFLYSAEELQVMLNSPYCLDKSMHYSFLRVNRGIFASPAHIWRGQRKSLRVSLGPAIANSSVDVFNEKSDILVGRLEQFADGKERDYFHDIAKCALDVIYYAALGLDFDMQRTKTGDYYLGLQDEFFDIIARRIFSPTLYPEFIYRLTKAYKREQEILRSARELTYKVMEQRRVEELMSSKTKENPSESKTDSTKPLNFLDSLLQLSRERQQLTKEDITQHLDTIIFAGSDTTSTTMASVLLMMAMHPDVQEKVYQEVMEICPDKKQYVSLDDIAKLTYIEQVCKETMRLFPVAPIVARVSTHDIKLNDKNTIPAHSQIIGAIYQVQRDPNIWGPKAHLFDPDNFLPEKAAKRHPYAYIPFSAGPRNCLGIRYAWLFMKIMIVHLLRKYRVKTSLTMDSLNIKYSILLKITNGCLISLEKRD
ncbi:cytochrome P450 4C1-like [Sabethes cyaneus]|uniref:cytochrome P450 4C1-like n=1 Tax=Sabethes cyaneus TaxID=53552 RepID=UPI00237E116C|nr:cytochrome P450 4C1-like [Sabethes cyaneus]